MAQQESQRSWGWAWTVVLVAVGLAAFLVVHFNHAAVPVRTARVERQDIVSTVSTNGKVEPTANFQAHAPGPGVVDKLFVTLNEHVRAGQELVKMDDTYPLRDIASAEAGIDSATANLNSMLQGGNADELISAKADLAHAEMQVKGDMDNLSSLQKLQAQGASSANEVAQARQRLSDDQVHLDQLQTRRSGRYSAADVAAQRALISQSRANLAAAQRGYANVDVRAPFSGTVYTIPVSQYDFVQPGETLLGVADLEKLQIMAYFDEPEIGMLKTGEAVDIVWAARPNEVWHGHILEAPSTVIGYGTRNVGECLITVDDAKGDLLPNTNVTVSVTTQFRPNVLSLPREALHTEGANDFVYKIVNEKLVRTPVKVGTSNLTRFEITDGLQQGDIVVLGATTEAELSDGMRVEAQP